MDNIIYTNVKEWVHEVSKEVVSKSGLSLTVWVNVVRWQYFVRGEADSVEIEKVDHVPSLCSVGDCKNSFIM